MNTNPTRPKSGVSWWTYALIALAIGLTIVNYVIHDEEEPTIDAARTDNNTKQHINITSGGIGYSSSSNRQIVEIILHLYAVTPPPAEYQKQMFGIATSLNKFHINKDYGLEIFVFERDDHIVTTQYVQKAIDRALEQYPNANCITVKSIQWYWVGRSTGMGTLTMQPIKGEVE